MFVVSLAKIRNEGNKIRKTLSSDSRRGYQADVFLRVIVIPVESSIDSLLCKGEYGLVKSFSKLVLG
jgi:hypothetical protein